MLRGAVCVELDYFQTAGVSFFLYQIVISEQLGGVWNILVDRLVLYQLVSNHAQD